MRDRKLYQTRLIYASMILTADEHPMWLANQISHANKKMIGRVYGKFIPNEMTDSCKKL